MGKETEGLGQALQLLHRCATPDGFVAAATDKDNYHRIWGRDGVIIGLAALLTEDAKLRSTFLATLRTLKAHQGPHGEIPSNVNALTGDVSYGGTAGRVDADLWFMIGCAEYWKITQDEQFLAEFLPHLERVRFLLGAWEFNARGLLYVPQTGDWSDEYVQHGYILYDQLLYLRALMGMRALFHGAASVEHHGAFDQKIDRLRGLIQANYWFHDHCDIDKSRAYHHTLYKRACAIAEVRNQHWLSFFSPTEYGYRFDALANVLAGLLGVATEEQCDMVDAYIAREVVNKDMLLLPAFHPVINPGDDVWDQLQVAFRYSFKNKPYEFHNGGLWPFVTGFYVVDLARRGKTTLARAYADAIHRANALDVEGDGWGFYEYLHGKQYTPGGIRHQGWSAAAAIMGHYAIEEHTFVLQP
ncbi:MAG: glycoside hydrolase 100 family protein [Candidatus Peribacteraceae bacterium]